MTESAAKGFLLAAKGFLLAAVLVAMFLFGHWAGKKNAVYECHNFSYFNHDGKLWYCGPADGGAK